jgi:hypothetical protein
MIAPLHPSPSLGIQIPDSFRTSYSNIDLYPSNLIHKSTYPAALEAFSRRLNKLAPKLFRLGHSLVPFLEFTGVGTSSSSNFIVLDFR